MAQHKRSGPKGQRESLYDKITARIIAEMEAGRLPWVQPWNTAHAGPGLPYNAVSGRPYSGINILTLWDTIVTRGFRSPCFLTFRQAVALGGWVRKGECGTCVIYAHRFLPGEDRCRAEAEGRKAPGGIPFLKHFTVFGLDQCEGLPEHLGQPGLPVDEGLILPEAQALIAATGADFRIGGYSAFYSPSLDYVMVPRPEDFHDPINWHRTAFHELGHWTGGKVRLDRDQSGAFGSPSYGREELVAEMAAAFVCAALGIAPTVRHADYIAAWLDILREDNRAIVRAASAASKAADYLLGFREAGRGRLSNARVEETARMQGLPAAGLERERGAPMS